VQLSLSHDDRRVAVQHGTGVRAQILIYDERGAATRFAQTAGGPVWSPDGREMIYYSSIGGANALYRKSLSDADGTRILPELGSPIPEDWSRDGRFVVGVSAAGVPGLFVVPVDGGKPRSLHGSDEPQFSPDSRWLVYQSNESGPSQVYLQPFPGPGERLRLSIDGGRQPKWRADGKEIYYLNPDGMLMAQTLRLGERVESDEPQPLFQTRLLASPIYDQFAVTADGQRFLVATPTGQTQTPLVVVVNWPASLPTNRK
jgi:Tol biopolymer transport system component